MLLQEGFGELDEARWRENYLPTFKDVEKVRRMTMRDVVADKSVFLSEEQVYKLRYLHCKAFQMFFF